MNEKTDQTEAEIVQAIIRRARKLEDFWRNSHGWAPPYAAKLLEDARLDRQTSFTTTLSEYLNPFLAEQNDAKQIMGYATLRSLCEGMLKLFLAVWLDAYLEDPQALKDRSGSIVRPEELKFDGLIVFYTKRISSKHETFLRRVQRRGNAIHYFYDRDIGNQQELIEDIIQFGAFLESVDGGLPYPDAPYYYY